MAECRTRILIVDSNRYLSGKICEQLYADVNVCCVSQSDSLDCAQGLAQGHKFEIIIMDALSVRMSRDLFRDIKAGNPGAKILLYSTELTGAEFTLVRKTALEAGADFFGDETQLLDRVREELHVANSVQGGSHQDGITHSSHGRL